MKKHQDSDNIIQISDLSKHYKIIKETGKCNPILGTTFIVEQIDSDTTPKYFMLYVSNDVFDLDEQHLKWIQTAKSLTNQTNFHPNTGKIIHISTNGQSLKHSQNIEDDNDKQQPVIISEFYDNSLIKNQLGFSDDISLIDQLYSKINVDSPLDSISLWIPLNELIGSQFHLTSTNKQIIIYGIVSAMKYLHKNHICHHELTPFNIFVKIKGIKKVPLLNSDNQIEAYFLETEFVDIKISNYAPSVINMTYLNNYPLIKQSLPYYAPESLQNGIFDKMTDVYSFGIILYQLLTNDAKPYSQLDEDSSIQLKVPIGYRPNILVSLPFQFQKMIETCIDQDPDNRPSFRRLADLLSTERYIIENCNIVLYNQYVSRLNEIEMNLDIYKQPKLFNDLSSDDEEPSSSIIKDASFIGKEDSQSDDDDDDDDNEEEDITMFTSNSNLYSSSFFMKPKDLVNSTNEIKIVDAAFVNIQEYFNLDDIHEFNAVSNDVKDFLQNIDGLENDLNECNIDTNLLEKAKSGDIESCYQLYSKLVEGIDGFPKNIDEAILFLKYAADHDHEQALFTYANMLIEGKIVPLDYLTAFHYFKKSAELYHNEISYIKCGMFLEAQNQLELAKKYYIKAMDNGNLDAVCHYAYILEKESELESHPITLTSIRNPDKDSSLSKNEKAMEMYQQSAEKGNVLGLYHYERTHQSPPFDPKLLVQYATIIETINPKKAASIYKRAADFGDPEAEVGYGKMLEKGLCGKENLDLAFFYYEAAYKAHNPRGTYHYARALQNGIGTQKNLQLACEVYKKAALLGDPDAMNSYGKMLEAGVAHRVSASASLPHSSQVKLKLPKQFHHSNENIMNFDDDDDGQVNCIEEAAKYYKMAADAKNPEGLFNYGRILELGCAKSIPRDINESFNYYKMAADAGNSDGMYNTARMLQDGIGTSRDLKLAFYYFKKASQTKNPRAMNSTGFMLLKGFGTEKDEMQALKYFKMGADAGSSVSMNNYAEMLEKGEGTPNHRKNRAMALKYFIKAADLNDSNAMNNYARYLENGIHIQKNIEKAMEYYKKSAGLRNPDGLYNYGRVLETYIRDYEQASKYYEQGAKARNIKAMKRYAQILELGNIIDTNEIRSVNNLFGVQQNFKKAIRFYEIAADSGDVDCMVKTAQFYEEGRPNVNQNMEKAAHFYRKASEHQSEQSMFKFAEMLNNGIGVHKDVNEAKLLFKKLADKGDEKSMMEYAMIAEKNESNIQEALSYYIKAASIGQNNSSAYYNSGRMLELLSNKENPPNEEEMKNAAVNYKTAADMGDNNAMFKYAMCLTNGQGVQKNFVMAYKYLRKASQTGNVEAISHAGIALKDGVGVTQDLEQAEKLFKQGAEAGDPVSMTNYAIFLLEDNKVDEARQLLYKAAELKETTSYYYIAHILEDDSDQFVEMLKYYRLSADENKNMKSMKICAELLENPNDKIHYYQLLINTFEETQNKEHVFSDDSSSIDNNDFYSAVNSLGKLYLSLNQNDNAANIFKIAIPGNDPETFFYYAQLINNASEKMKYYKLCADSNSSSVLKYEAAYQYALILKDQKLISEFETYMEISADGKYIPAVTFYSNYLSKSSRIDESMKYVKVLADQDDIESILKYAEYSQSIKNNSEARKYYSKAADMNNPIGLYQYGQILESEEDYSDALIVYDRSSKLNNQNALTALGHMYQNGLGVNKDLNKAFDYYKEANTGESLCNIGQLFEEKQIPSNDQIQSAFDYYKMSAETGYKKGILRYALFLENGIGTPDNQPNEKLAAEYYDILAKRGDMACMRHAAGILIRSSDIEKKKKAVQYFKAASDLGDVESMYQFGCLLENGVANEVLKKNERMAATLIKNSADSQYEDAIIKYSNMLMHGIGVRKSKEESIRYLQQAADNGSIKGIFLYVDYLRSENKLDDCLTYLKKLSADLRTKDDEENLSKVNNLIADISEEMQNHTEAALLYKENADTNNNVPAMMKYARMLLDGIGVEQNTREAAHYFKKAADLDSLEGMVEYAKLSQKGYGDTADGNEGISYLKKAQQSPVVNSLVSPSKYPIPQSPTSKTKSDFETQNTQVTPKKVPVVQRNGSPLALMSIGRALSSGFFDLGDPEELNEAVHYFKKAADMGSTDGMYNYAKMCSKGIGVEQNIHEAFNYYMLGSHQPRGDDEDNKYIYKSMRKAARMLQQGIGATQNLQQATEMFKEAAEKGRDPYSMYAYASILMKESESEKNSKKQREMIHTSAQFFKMATQNGIIEAAVEYGKILEDGIGGIDRNTDEALSFYHLAADMDNSEALYRIGRMLESGVGVDKSSKEARHYYLRAAELGNADAMFKIGNLYKKGKGGLPKSKQQAMLYYQKAADLGHVQAMMKYASMRKKYGNPTMANLNDAKNYYEKAIVQGSPKAKTKLQKLEKRIVKKKSKHDIEPPPKPPE